MNKLHEIFFLQKELRKKIGNGNDFLSNLTDKEKGDWTRNYLDYIRQEVSEAYDCLAYKHWDEQGKRERNKILKPENLKIELIDIFFFMVDIFSLNDMTDEEVFEFYKYKWQKNMRRQDEKYDVLTKTEGDNLNIEDKIKRYYNEKRSKTNE